MSAAADILAALRRGLRRRAALAWLLVAAVGGSMVVPAAQAAPRRPAVPEILQVERPWPALIAVRVSIGGGANLDPQGQEGLALLGWNAALRGAGARRRAELAEALDALGARLEVAVDKHSAVLYGDVAADRFEPFAQLLADVLLRPRFDAAEVEAVRAELIADLQHLQDDDEAQAGDAAGRYLYRGQPQGRPTAGTVASLRAIDAAKLAAWHKRLVVAGNLRVGLAGDLRGDGAKKVVLAALEALPSGAVPSPKLAKPVADGRRLLLIDKQRRTQAQVVLAMTAAPARHRDLLAMLVGNAVLGGTFTSRLNREIRELRGWAYQTWSALAAAPGTSTWSLGFASSNRDTPAALAMAVKVVEEMQRLGVTAAELRHAKDWLKGAHGLAMETATGELAQRMRFAELGLPQSDIDQFAQRVEAVDAKAVQRALREQLRPEHLVGVVVGSGRSLADKLSASSAGFQLERIGASDLPEDTTAAGLLGGPRVAPAASEPDDGSHGSSHEPENGEASAPEEDAEEAP